MTEHWASRFYVILLSLALAVSGGCAGAGKGATAPTSAESGEIVLDPAATNREELKGRPYVILVSIDGYRWDYNKLFSPPHLSRLEDQGVKAESLRPVYPSKTFPNHYSIVTGLYADKHGIVANEFYDPARKATFALSDRKSIEDGSWYSGEPLWNSIKMQGLLTASYFWVGSEANIQGTHPSYYYRYDQSVPSEHRVDGVIGWLKLPVERRPHFITLYFDEVDSAAHRSGFDSPETRAAVMRVDAAIGKLMSAIEASGLPVNVIVVSDHGMADLSADKVVLVDRSIAISELLSKFNVVGRGPQMLLYLKEGEDPKWVRTAQRVLLETVKNVRVFRRDELEPLRLGGLPRSGDLVIEADMPYSLGLKAKPPAATGANHGWDPTRAKEMHGVFLATGPAFKPKSKLPTFDNVHVYPLVMEILGLRVETPIDGRADVTAKALRRVSSK